MGGRYFTFTTCWRSFLVMRTILSAGCSATLSAVTCLVCVLVCVLDGVGAVGFALWGRDRCGLALWDSQHTCCGVCRVRGVCCAAGAVAVAYPV